VRYQVCVLVLYMVFRSFWCNACAATRRTAAAAVAAAGQTTLRYQVHFGTVYMFRIGCDGVCTPGGAACAAG
jgi:hypothetical protein